MRTYVCDKCGRKIIRKAAIKEKECVIKFPMEYKKDEEGVDRRMYGGFKIKLLSNLWDDLCTVCIQELIAENINNK
jgi:hypothetical protein